MRRIWATPGLDDLPAEEWKVLLAHLADLGFMGIEPLIAGPYALPIGTIQELLQKSGLAITGLRTGAITVAHGVTLGHPDSAVRAEAVARLSEVIRYGAQFGQPRILVGLMQGRLEQGQTVGQAKEHITDSLRLCADEAAQYGMEIDLEPVNRYELGYHSNVYEIMDVVRRTDKPNVRILIDTFHMNIEESSIGAALVSAASLIGHVHIADSNRLAPGMGHFDFSEFFAVLESVGYNGDVTVEALYEPDQYEAARISARYLDCIKIVPAAR
ncbi:MAG: sugar phosphate isomerase/epimerase family protein [Chloroflexota bacterium]